jgi:hypothetical protein
MHREGKKGKMRYIKAVFHLLFGSGYNAYEILMFDGGNRIHISKNEGFRSISVLLDSLEGKCCRIDWSSLT